MESIYLCVFDSPVAVIVRRAVILTVGMQDANWDRNTVEIEFLEWMPISKRQVTTAARGRNAHPGYRQSKHHLKKRRDEALRLRNGRPRDHFWKRAKGKGAGAWLWLAALLFVSVRAFS
jgi:hypothetical protein